VGERSLSHPLAIFRTGAPSAADQRSGAVGRVLSHNVRSDIFHVLWPSAISVRLSTPGYDTKHEMFRNFVFRRSIRDHFGGSFSCPKPPKCMKSNRQPVRLQTARKPVNRDTRIPPTCRQCRCVHRMCFASHFTSHRH
jgi:hypothetical protein